MGGGNFVVDFEIERATPHRLETSEANNRLITDKTKIGMRSFTLTLIATIATMAAMIASAAEASAQRLTIVGRVVNADKEPIAYATVVALRDGEQASGMTSDNEGRFSLALPPATYTLNISYLGYKSDSREVELIASCDIGDIILEAHHFS